MPLTIFLNGHSKALEISSSTLSDLIQYLGFKPDRVAVEVNGLIISRAKWPETHLADGDKLELVQFVGGGTPTSR